MMIDDGVALNIKNIIPIQQGFPIYNILNLHLQTKHITWA